MSKHVLWISAIVVALLSIEGLAQPVPKADWTTLGTNVIIFDQVPDGFGDLYITGEYFGSTSFAGGQLPAPDNAIHAGYFFLARLNSEGRAISVITEQSHPLNPSEDSSTCAGMALAVDSAGNLYALGQFNCSLIQINGKQLRNTEQDGSADAFLIKFTPDGSLDWIEQLGGDGDDIPVAIAASKDHLYAGGYFSSTKLGIGADSLSNSATDGTSDAWLAQFDFDGNATWKTSYGGADGDDEINGVVADASDNFFVTADFASTGAVIDGHSIANTSVGDVITTMAYKANASLTWLATSDAGSSGQSVGLGVDRSGNVTITGEFQGNSITFGSITVTNTAPTSQPQNLVVVRYDASGNVLSAIGGGTSAPDSNGVYPIGCAVDAGGRAYITGGFGAPSMTIGGHTLLNPVPLGSALFALELERDNSFGWAYIGGGLGENTGDAISVNPDSSVNFVGVISGTGFTLDGRAIPNLGEVTGIAAQIALRTAAVPATETTDLTAALYPDPLTSIAMIHVPASMRHGALSLRVYDMLGRVVRSSSAHTASQIAFDRAGLASGTYRILLRDALGNQASVKAIIE